ncbi:MULTISPECIES: PqiC family protein [Pseudomonas]|uniref:ABC-type transport auxiliary lipoprotein component domain-containing protein n=1 Tax=Pseudomonas putida NBRC 14164 TaxID=1211579 RepID=A0ABN5UMC7_PSEPU|nr:MULTISPECIES: PqiC family protein [Pseudomonas]EKT4554716.1 membrane integrity-associated transporter subunit PqiC [Pseudomonas putida]MCX9135102.1 PqiC family protein [Pseudomonas sp. DCB_PUT]MDD1971364.1 PqiC family protein [Pseudomonas putida]MDO1463605.1 membrane integrity-associated transporter subunit PqiC [Pseudomonas putida]MDO1468982.1 membrane integrity-associated transporter subunit PqiC [Pseudomonas putida]
MALPFKITLLLACTLLAACRSDPIQFHTLTPAQPGGAHGGADVVIEGLSVPPQVDRPQMVIRQGNSGLAILETQWWGASLADELRSALTDQLSHAGGRRKASVRLEVQRFDSIPGQYGLIDVKWRLRAADASELLTCRSTLQTPAGPSIDDVVSAQQNNVKRLANLISRAASGDQSSCPSAQ